MICYKLTSNFNYLESDKFNSRWKNAIIDFIEDAEKFDNPERNIKSVSNALDCLLNEFITRNNLIKDFNPTTMNLGDKIHRINETGRVTSSKYLFNIMKELKNTRNFVEHKHNDINPVEYHFNDIDICGKLKNLFFITKNLFSEIIPENLEFNIKCYSIHNINDKDISAISKQQRENDNVGYDEISQDLKIDNDSIKSWLSIQKAKLVIPIYQRKYEWTDENIKVLFDDIVNRMEDEEEHYFGTIVQKKKIGHGINNPDLIKIIDGQQRITTSFLFVCAARQLLLEKKYANNCNEIDWYQDIISKHYYKNNLSEYITNPGGTEKYNNQFKKILDNVKGKSSEELQLDLNIKFSKNYKKIYELLKEKFNTNHEIYNFINTFLNKFKVATISFDYDKFTNKREMEIFESLNSKGLELSITDLIKNHLFNFCSEQLINNNADDITKRYHLLLNNTQIENNLEDFYVTLAELINGNELSKFKRERYTSIKNAIDDLLIEYKNVDSIETYGNMMNYLEKYIHIYNECAIKTDEFISFIECTKIINVIHDKKKRKLFTYFAYIIFQAIRKNYHYSFDFINNNQQVKLQKNEIKSIQNLFLEITKFIIRTKVITKQGDSGIKRLLIEIAQKYYSLIIKYNITIEKLCTNIINELKHKTETKYPHSNFKTSLEKNENHNQIIELLLLTELIMTDTLFGGEEVTRLDRSIEHILPQDSSEWKNLVDINERDNFEEKANLYKEKIGNYLILTKTKNSKAKNYLFNKKKEMVYKGLVSPLYVNNINCDIDISNKNEWTFEHIDKRTKALIDYIVSYVIKKDDLDNINLEN